MHCANTMWRFKLIVLFVFFCSGISAQESDSAYLVRYASTLDQLYPGLLYPVVLADSSSCDSSLFVRKDAIRQLKMTHKVFVNPQNSPDSGAVITHSQLNWNNQGRIVFCSYSIGETVKTIYAFSYKNGKILNNIIRKSGGENADTLRFSWDRSGKINGETYSFRSGEKDSVQRLSRLFDSQGRIIVVTGISYGPLVQGAFTYEYDTKGRLVRRSLSTRLSGAVLCSDTLIYSFTDSAKTILRTHHLLRIAGKPDWVSIDEKTENIHTHQLTEYILWNGPAVNDAMNVPVHHLAHWKYDLTGRVENVFTGNTDVDRGIRTVNRTYYYDEKGRCDSIRADVRYGTLKSTELISTRLFVISYKNDSELRSAETVSEWKLEGKGKKKKWKLTGKATTAYDWN